MFGQKKKSGVAAAAAFFMFLTLAPQPGIVSAVDKTLISEDYTDATLIETDVGALGWTKTENLSWVNPDSTKVAVEEGGLRIQKTGPTWTANGTTPCVRTKRWRPFRRILAAIRV